MICENCTSEMLQVHGQSHFHCQPCNRFQFPESLPCPDGLQKGSKVTEFECLICVDSKLQVGEVCETQVCFCTQCRGMIIDQASFGDLVEILRTAYQGDDDQPVLLDGEELKKLGMCPVCDQVMDTFAYAGPGTVVLDSCNQCRLVWLNHGELGRIVRAPGRRDYGRTVNLESEMLRAKFYSQGEGNQLAGLMILAGIFG